MKRKVSVHGYLSLAKAWVQTCKLGKDLKFVCGDLVAWIWLAGVLGA